MSREAADRLGIPLPPRIVSIAGINLESQDDVRSEIAVERGRLAQKRGSNFEDALEATHLAWRHLGIASIRKLPVDTGPAPGRIRDPERKISPGTIRVLAKRQGFDYTGTLAGGRAFAMEAKATGAQKCSIRISDEDGVRTHQLESLADEIRRFGVIGCIIWNNGGRRLILPPQGVVNAHDRFKAGGRKSIPAEEFTEYQVTHRGEEYLAALQEE